MNIRFLRKVKTAAHIEIRLSEDEIARIQGEAEEKGKADFILEIEIKDDAGDVAAFCKGIYGVRKI